MKDMEKELIEMHNSTESAEKAHLELVKRKLSAALERLGGRVQRYAEDSRAQKVYMAEHRAEMDHVEKVSARSSAEQSMRSAETVVATRKRIQKLIRSPYFGRIDFTRQATGDGDAISCLHRHPLLFG